jgi:cyclase
MLTKRLIACFDVIDGRVTKARKFQNNVDVGAAEQMAAALYEVQIDEVIFYDIMASAQKRPPDLATIERVARQIFVPFTVGGGIKSLADMHAVLKSGAEKISVDSMAVRDPRIVSEGARAFGSQCIVVSMQVKNVGKSAAIPSGYEVAIDGARVFTGMDAIEWAKRVEGLGAGEIVVNSIDQDGTHEGYDLAITRAIGEAVKLPLIASGGAGTHAHVIEVFRETRASAAIISSLLYSPSIARNYTVPELKSALTAAGVHVRPLLPEASMS